MIVWRILGKVLLWLPPTMAWLWSLGAAACYPLLPAWINFLCVLLMLSLLALGWQHHDQRRLLKTLLVPALVWVLLLQLATPLADRNWVPEQQRMPTIEITGHHLQIRDLRDAPLDENQPITYRNLAFPLSRLTRVWFVVELLEGSEYVAHTFLSFGIEPAANDPDGDMQFFNVSIEVRRQQGEQYGPLKGLYRNFELMYVFATDDDMLGRRSILYDDVIYLLPIRARAEAVQQLFMAIAERTNRLRQTPEFYNTLTNNCTSNIGVHVNQVASQTFSMLDLRMILPGLSDRMLFEQGLVDTELDRDAARRYFRIDDKIRNQPPAAGSWHLIRRIK